MISKKDKILDEYAKMIQENIKQYIPKKKEIERFFKKTRKR